MKKNEELKSNYPFFTEKKPQSNPLFDKVLQKIPSKDFHHFSYHDLVLMANDLTEEELIKTLRLCFDKATENGYPQKADAKRTLLNIIKEIKKIPLDIQEYFIDILDKKIYEKLDENPRECAILALMSCEMIDESILVKLTAIVKNRITHSDERERNGAFDWLSLLLPKLSSLEGELVNLVIRKINELSTHYPKILLDIGSKLSEVQRSKYLQRYLSLIQSQKVEQEFRGCLVLSPLVASKSPCPDSIYSSLISLTRHHDEGISRLAMKSLSNLEPNRIIFASDVIERALSGDTNNTFVFEWIIKLAPIMEAEDIKDTWIDKLVHSKILPLGPCSQLEKRAYFLLIEKLNLTKLNTYIGACLELTNLNRVGRLLSVVPSQKLQGYNFYSIFAQMDDLLRSVDPNRRHEACKILSNYEGIEPIFPESLLVTFLTTLQDKALFVRERAFAVLPLLLNEYPDTYIKDIFEIILNNLTVNELEYTSWKMGQAVCDCLKKIAPKLNTYQISQSMNMLTTSANEKNRHISGDKANYFEKRDHVMVFLKELLNTMRDEKDGEVMQVQVEEEGNAESFRM